MIFLPAILSLMGLFLGPILAKRLDNCPHRGRVWGAFLLPLIVLAYPPLQMHAIVVSFSAALASGFTAHSDFKACLGAVAISCFVATQLVEKLL